MRKAELEGLVILYRHLIDRMQGQTFYIEDEEGALRRWHPPRRPILDKDTPND
jgi:hypothetical protein